MQKVIYIYFSMTFTHYMASEDYTLRKKNVLKVTKDIIILLNNFFQMESKNPEKNASWFLQKYWAAQLFSTLTMIRNVFLSRKPSY